MFYVYSRTIRDTQEYLRPWYKDNSADPFQTSKAIINYLENIYLNPYYVANIRRKF
jgi:hypothetical protein